MLIKLRHALSLILVVVSLSSLVWGIWPVRHTELVQTFLPDGMRIPKGSAATWPAILEVRQVKLDWPETLRIGDKGMVTLQFSPLSGEVLAPPPDIQYTDVYATYNLMAEGRLEAAGLHVDPANPRLESLPAGQTVKFTWQITADKTVSYPARAWLLLHFLPLEEGTASEAPIFVRDLDIRASSLLGMSGTVARLLGGLGIILGLALSLDVMIGGIKKLTTKGTRDTKEK